MRPNNLILILALLACIGLGYQIGRMRHCQEYEIAKTDSTTTQRYDSIPRVIAGEEGVTVLRTSEPVAPLSSIDTAEVIRQYFQKKGYSSTFENEEIRIKWDASVFQNALELGPLTYSILKPTSYTTTNTFTAKKRSKFMLYGGASSQLGINQNPSFGPSLSLVIKDNILLGLSYDVLGPSRNIGITFNYRLL